MIEKLAALVPPPRRNLVRYHGVLAANAADRQHIVPGPQQDDEADRCACSAEAAPAKPVKRAHRLQWARLLARVFRLDVSRCPVCGGPMKIIAALTDPHSIRTYLDGVGLPCRAPPVADARPDPQQEFDFAA